jgi:glycosyltransferase involved in cell wall biosynthesis
MKVALCAGWYLPESVGGTEAYVHALALGLRERGVESVVLAPQDGEAERRYVHDGIEVIRYPVPEGRSAEQHAGHLPHARFERFEQLLAQTRADVFHLHSITYGCNAHHLAAARALGMRTVTTFHVPGVVCARGTLMRFGRDACDGQIREGRCSVCWAEERGVPSALGYAATPLWRMLGPRLAGTRTGPAYTLLRTPERITAARASLLRIAELSTQLVAVCAWLRDALIANRVPADKITVCRQGVRLPAARAERGPRAQHDLAVRLRVGYFGRAAPVKGLDTIVSAVHALDPERGVRLSVHALVNSAEEAQCLERARAAAAGDAGIAFLAPVAADAVMDAMRDYDLIALPSRWLETGPIVAMQALAAGIPVLGSNLGGLRELIVPGETGWLLPHDDVAAWSRQLERLAAPDAAALRFELEAAGLIDEREVAARMHALYAATP